MSDDTPRAWPRIAAASIDAPSEARAVKISGTVPRAVRGSYLFNGPGHFRVGGLDYHHWLDGDGRVGRLRITDHGADFTSQWIHSTKWQEERQAGKALHRGFGTAFPGDRLLRGVATESPVNVSVYPHGNRLLAFGEQGLPWELDSDSLATKKRWTFNGSLTEITPFTGHPKVDPVNGELMGFGVSFSASHPSLTYFRFDRDGSLLTRSRQALPGPYAIHDFAVSKHHIAFHISPYTMSMPALQTGGTVLDALNWPEDGQRPESRLLILDRKSGETLSDLPIGRAYCLHLANAFDTEGGVVVDLLEMARPIYTDYRLRRLLQAAPTAVPVRLQVNFAASTVERREIQHSNHADFPTIDRRHFGLATDACWMLAISSRSAGDARPYYDQLVRVDWQQGSTEVLWQAPSGCLLAGEPAFVGSPDDPSVGWIVAPLHEPAAKRFGFGLWNAWQPGDPIARFEIADGSVHLAFHSIFVPDGIST